MEAPAFLSNNQPYSIPGVVNIFLLFQCLVEVKATFAQAINWAD